MTVNFIVPILIFLLAIPLLFDKIPRNRWYGFRTPTSMSSDQAWYYSNKVAAKGMCVAAAIWMVASLVLSQRMADKQQASMMGLLFGPFCLVVVVIVTQVIATRHSRG
ncbi:MAG: SdpI family protein [Bryobacterales bacterium]|nr:SdpI family protein [Bryobacterales bacterium]